MKVETCVVGPIQTNCYIIENDGEVIVVDPGDDLTIINSELAGRPVSQIIATHFHFDHICALSGLASLTGAPIAASATDAPLIDGISNSKGHDLDRGYGAPHVSRLLREGDEVKVGNATFKVIETPGHSQGSICLYDADDRILITGDTLFANGSYGRTDFEYGSMDQMVNTLQTKFVDIPDDVTIYPGHMRSSTLGRERKLNPYLR